MRRKHRAAEEADVNLTPLLDIVFIMLIFFIVTATFVKEKGIEVFKPQTQEQPPEQEQEVRNIVINIDSRGIIEIDLREIDLRAIRANVERLHAERPGAAVIVRPEPDAETGLLVRVMDQVRLAGIENVSISPPL